MVGGIFGHILGQIRTCRRLAEIEEELLRRSRLSLLGEISATVAHEISQPLSAIRSEAAAMRAGCPPEAVDSLRAIEESAGRAGQILSNLRGWLRNTDSVKEDRRIDALLDDVLILMNSKLHARGIHLEKQWPEDLPAVRVAAVEIRQVLANLLLNASEALAGHPGERKILVSARTKGRRLWTRVEDNGPGFAPGMEEKIFAPLFTTRPEGTGMGLAICRRMIEGHGGKITASRRRGGGARFEFSLPVVKK